LKNLIHLPTTAPETILKKEANKQLKALNKKLVALQNLFFAEKKHSLLIVLQGMDASGKDGTIRHVLSGINPQGCNVKSFKSPTEEEKAHDFLWRIVPHFPAKGYIQVFNRSHYEDVLFPVVHKLIDKKEVQERLEMINHLERHLQKNNTIVLKFYLHISQKEQKVRLNKRIKDPLKRWKYNPDDKKEARQWKDYMEAYQHIFEGCQSTNPWFLVPADAKWYRNFFIAKTIVEKLESLKMKYPK
jgi:PPK2 family polyphosphate:nucleotide phosphotransferase